MITEQARPAYDGYAALRDEAGKRCPRLVNPAELGTAPAIVGRRGHDWATAVLGRYYRGPREISHIESWMLRVADEWDIAPPLPAFVVEARAAETARQAELDARRQAAEQRDLAAWHETLEKAGPRIAALLQVRRNPHARPRSGYAHQLGHVVPTVDFRSRGRRHREGRALCEAIHRTDPLQLGEVDDGAATCDRCLAYVPQLLGPVEDDQR